MKLFLITFILSFSFISFADICAQDEEPIDEIAPWQVSEVKFSFLKTQSFKSEQLNNIVATTSGTDLNINTVINDMITLKKFYFDNGFFNAIVDSMLNYNKEDNEVIVVFTIIENEQSRYNEIKYIGLDSLAQNVQDSIFNPARNQFQKEISPGQTYSRARINLEIGRILNILQNNGYAFAKKQEVKVTNIFSTNPDLQNTVDIDLYFYTGALSRFGNTEINISSNKYGITKDYIRRNLEYSEGQIYDKRKLNESTRKILANAIIESSSFDFNDSTTDSTNGKVDLVLKVSIRNKYEITPELLAYEIDNRFYGGVGLSFYDRFFLQGSRVFNASLRGLVHDLKFNRLENSVQVSESYLFGNPNLAGNIRLGLNFLNIDSVSAIEISGKAGVSLDLPTFTYINKLIFSSEVLNQDLRINYTDTLGAPKKVKLNYFASSIGISALHLGIDDPVFPTKGFNQTFTAQEGGLLGQLLEQIFSINVFKFIKSTASNKIFFNFSDNVKSKSVLGIKFNIGVIFETGINDIQLDTNEIEADLYIPGTPLNLQFTAGGGINNRGWRANTLGFVQDQKDGGNFSIDGMFEHRLRPFINSTNSLIKDLGFVYFLDYGNVWENISKFKLDQIAMSTGVGIRYYTIIGAVRVDLGLKLYDPNPGHVGVTKWIFQNGANLNDKYTIQFGIGNTF
jgi:outer membrane protein assembly factor BamA